jgi:hypothetical protein
MYCSRSPFLDNYTLVLCRNKLKGSFKIRMGMKSARPSFRSLLNANLCPEICDLSNHDPKTAPNESHEPARHVSVLCLRFKPPLAARMSPRHYYPTAICTRYKPSSSPGIFSSPPRPIPHLPRKTAISRDHAVAFLSPRSETKDCHIRPSSQNSIHSISMSQAPQIISYMSSDPFIKHQTAI